MKQFGFGEEVKCVENGLCPFCKEKVNYNDFKDELSKEEFKNSGLCQTCQDNFFK